MDPEQTLKAYENDANAKETIRKAISGAYEDLRPELELVHGYETAGMPTFYNSFNTGYGMGTGADQMDPLARLNSASQNVALKSAAARTARGVLDTRRAGMENLIGDTWEQWNVNRQNAKDAYDRWFAKKQYEESIRQFEEQMKLQRYIASRSGGGGGGTTIVYNGENGGGTGEDPNTVLKNAIATAKATRFSPNKPANFNIDAIHSQLMDYAKANGIKLDSESLWVQLGNTPKGGQSTELLFDPNNPLSKYTNKTSGSGTFNLTGTGYGGLSTLSKK